MKRIMVIVALSVVLLITGCTANDLDSGSDNSGYQTTYFHLDWPSYATAEEIVNASTHIYSGTVTDVSFEIIDYSTGKVDRDRSSTSTSRTLYTVYTIRTDKNYKGNSSDEVKICKMGGISGFREEEQFELLDSSGLIQPRREEIPISDDNCKLDIGKKYLFCISRNSNEFDFIINPYQFAHDIDSKDAKDVIGAIE